MADQLHNTETQENLNRPTHSCPILIAASNLGSNLPNLSGLATPVLSNLWIQPPFPHLPVRLIPGNTSLQTFLPPGVSHLQIIQGEHLHLANLAACNPPASAFPQTFYAPPPPQYETLADTGNHQQIPRPPYPQHWLPGPSLQEVRAPEEESQKAQTFHLSGSLDQPRSSLHAFEGSPLAPSSSLHYNLEDIPHLLPGLEVSQAPGHPSNAIMEIEVPQASPDQEASEPHQGKCFGLSVSQFHPPSKGKGKRKTPGTEEEPPGKKSKEEEKTQLPMPSKNRAKRQQRTKLCKDISVKVAADAPKAKIFPSLLQAPQKQSQDKMPTELLTVHEDPKVELLETFPQQPGEQCDSSASKGSQRVHTSSGLDKSQPKSQNKQEAKKNVSLCGAKSRREAEGAPKPVPKTNLACKLMESVQVFHPLGQQNVPSLPSKKVHSVLPQKPVPDNLSTKPKLLPKSSAIPSSQPLITAPKPPLCFLPASRLHSQYKPPAFSMSELPSHPPSKPLSHCLTKPQSQPWQKRLVIPVPVPTWPPKTQGKQVPLATIPPATKTSDSALPPRRGWTTQAAAPGKTASLGSKPAGVAQNVGHSSNMAAATKDPVPKGPPSSPPYKGDTFRPWRMPPPDLEVSRPITDEQRPIREKMKREAQKEREEAACWTSLGRIKAFEEREKEMDISIHYGYPSFGCPWRTSTWVGPRLRAGPRLQAWKIQPQLRSDFQSTRD